MPPFGPIRRADLIYYLRRAGFEGPHRGGRHEYMIRSQRKLRLPNPHQGDVRKGLLALILREAGITREEWDKL